MPTHLDMPLRYEHDDPHAQEPRARRYGWTILLYVSFAVLITILFLMVR
jgi:hypothetical protein